MSDPAVVRFRDRADLLLAHDVVAALAAEPKGLNRAEIRRALGLRPRSRRVCDLLRQLYAAGLIDLGDPGSRWRLVRQPRRGELGLHPRKPVVRAAPGVSPPPAEVVWYRPLDVQRSERSRLAVEVAEGDEGPFVRIVREIRAPNGWHPRRSIAATPAELDELIDVLRAAEVAR